MSRRLINDLWQPLTVVGLALLVRVIYVTCFLEHRICHFGDAFYFLTTGNNLLSLIQSTHSFSEFASTLILQHEQLVGLAAMKSMSLADRLLIDGPVYPAYLALIEWVMKVNTHAPVFDSLCIPISMFNAVVDAIACLLLYRLGRLAFNRQTAFIAGLIFALYPPAIINTQHCYSEPLSYFLLLLFLNLLFSTLIKPITRLAKNRVLQIIQWLLLGLSAALVMLVKPIFVLIPPVLCVLVLVFKRKHLKPACLKKVAIPLVALVIGLSAVLGPWLCLTRTMTGSPTLFVSRAPSYNLYLGNHLPTDGWRAWPAPELIPHETKEAINLITKEGMHHPLKFIALELKKLPRLWAGVWNEYQYPLIGISPLAQQVWHDLLLLLGVSGALLIFFGRRPFFSVWNTGLILTLIIALHFTYCAFEPISRYAITAMPAIILLASYAISQAIATKHKMRLLVLSISAAVVFWTLGSAYDLRQTFEIHPWWQAILWIVLALGLLALMWRWLVQMLPANPRSNKLLNAILIGCAAITALVSIACSVYDPSWRESNIDLVTASEAVHQTIYLPALPEGAKPPVTSYILVDLASTETLPPLQVTVNNVAEMLPALPWALVRGISSEALQVLSIQGQGMGRDLKTFRQWWAIPISTADLKFGEKNEILIRPTTSRVYDKITIFGDRIHRKSRDTNIADGTTSLPSLERISWTKGFATYHHTDSRIYEPLFVRGHSQSKCFDSSQWHDCHRLRIRIAVPFMPLTAPNSPTPDPSVRFPAYRIAAGDKAKALIGKNLPTLIMTPKPLFLPNNLPSGSLFYFSCQLKGYEHPGNAYASVDFNGMDGATPVHWNSVWQPASITTYPEWRSASFADVIPDNVLKLKDLNVTILIAPFYPDQLFLKRKQALNKDAVVQDINFAILPPLDFPKAEECHWVIY